MTDGVFAVAIGRVAAVELMPDVTVQVIMRQAVMLVGAGVERYLDRRRDDMSIDSRLGTQT